jgi:hypothetical protein
MGSPRPGERELLLRGSVTEGYQLIDPATQKPVADALRSLTEVVAAARRHGATKIWQERVALRGYSFPVPPRS